MKINELFPKKVNPSYIHQLKTTIMTRQIIAILLAFLILTTANAQTKKASCGCPKSEFGTPTKANATFNLSNGKTIVLCGYKNPDSKPTSFSEFVLAVCGQDTNIDFWGAMSDYRLKVNKDTLLVAKLQNLPIGKDFKYQETVWSTEKIYFSEQDIVRKLVANRKIKKYNQDEIKKVLKEYKTAKPGLDDRKMVLADKLLMATISGDKTARQYFEEFATKFGTLDGGFSESYSDMTEMLELWDTKE